MAKSGEVAQAAPAEIATATVEGLDGGPTHEHPIPDDRPAPGRHPRLLRQPARPHARRSTSSRARAPGSTLATPPPRSARRRGPACSPGRSPFRHKLLANHERNVGYLEDLARRGSVRPSRGGCETAGYNVGLSGKWHVGDREPADYGFDGTHLPGWHNPVDHPRLPAWLADRDPAVSEVHDPIRGDPSQRPTGQPAGRAASTTRSTRPSRRSSPTTRSPA